MVFHLQNPHLSIGKRNARARLYGATTWPMSGCFNTGSAVVARRWKAVSVSVARWQLFATAAVLSLVLPPPPKLLFRGGSAVSSVGTQFVIRWTVRRPRQKQRVNSAAAVLRRETLALCDSLPLRLYLHTTKAKESFEVADFDGCKCCSIFCWKENIGFYPNRLPLVGEAIKINGKMVNKYSINFIFD